MSIAHHWENSIFSVPDRSLYFFSPLASLCITNGQVQRDFRYKSVWIYQVIHYTTELLDIINKYKTIKCLSLQLDMITKNTADAEYSDAHWA